MRRGLADLAVACAAAGVVTRWRAEIVTVEGSDCLWWTGAVSERGHGRFWLGPTRVVVAHRFAFALAHRVAVAASVVEIFPGVGGPNWSPRAAH